MSYVDEQSNFAFDITQLIKFAILEGFQVTFSQAERPKELNLLYYYGYKIVEVDNDIKLVKHKQRSKTKDSLHRKRRAIDLNFFKDGLYINGLKISGTNKPDKEKILKHLQPLANYFKSLNPKNRWGGEFKNIWDPDHFERR